MYAMRAYVFSFQPPPKITSPFHKTNDEDDNNENKIKESMKAIKKMIDQADTRSRTEQETEK